MHESHMIEDYLTALSAQLPAPVVDEMADGLDETRQRYLSQGLEDEPATDAALAEFGAPEVIMADFARQAPGCRAARRILAAGPAVGGCWGIALITSRAWTWPVPAAGRLLLGVALVTVIGLLAAASFGKKYRSVGRAGAAGCAGMTMLDTVMLVMVAVAVPVLAWPVFLAAAASAARLTFTARTLRTLLAG